jgi:hypothetical protein
VKQAIAARIQVWDESVAAFYFALLGVHLLSSVCFAIATWNSDDKWGPCGGGRICGKCTGGDGATG